MEISQSLKTVLKRLKLSGILITLPDRTAYARKSKLALPDFLELVLQDEIDRREYKNLATRLSKACFEQEQTLESFDWDAPITFDRDRVRDLFSLGFLERSEDVLLLGPVGVGKTFIAGALGHAACRAGKRVRFLRADTMLRGTQSSACRSHGREVYAGSAHARAVDHRRLRTSTPRCSRFQRHLRDHHRAAPPVVNDLYFQSRRHRMDPALRRSNPGAKRAGSARAQCPSGGHRGRELSQKARAGKITLWGEP